MARAARKEPTVRELDERLTKLESRLEESESNVKAGFERLESKIDAAQNSNDVMFKVLFRQREDDRVLADQRQAIADQRHAEIMAQFEKLLARPSEN
jgi:hypothetical protein